MTIWFIPHEMKCAALDIHYPHRSPWACFIGSRQFPEQQACFSEGTCKTELPDRKIMQATAFEHGYAYQAADDHVHKEFLVEGFRCQTMPGGRTDSALKIAIESLDVPTHVIESGQFRSRELDMVHKRGHQTTAAKTVSANENYSDIRRGFVVGVLHPTEIITLAQYTLHLWAQIVLDGNDEVGTTGHDL